MLTLPEQREEKFFSKDITHVITTRLIPPAKKTSDQDTTNHITDQNSDRRGQYDMPRTIDPSLLSRDTGTKDVRRRLLESTGRKLPAPAPVEDSLLRQPTASRKTDILVRAREMDKKIWAFSKLVKILEMLNDPDPFGTAAAPKAAEEANLAQLLNKERTSGPSDRDPTVATKELVFFKGPYIYVYDIEEKQKPIMVREYAKVADKKDGDWPQFRSTQHGRCPFVEDDELSERKRHAEKAARDKERQERAANDAAPALKPPPAPSAKAGVPKRTLTDMEDGHNVRSTSSRVPEVFDLAKAANPPTTLDFSRPQNAFTSRARSARLLAGEPVASGVQKSNITSAIRSQMISSASGIRGAKAGTSKELYGLQRQVLEKSNAPSANPTSQDMSSRRLAEMSLDNSANQRSASLGVSSRKLAQIEEERSKEHKRTQSVPVSAPATKPKKRDLKPGYCENCQDKFADFDEVSRARTFPSSISTDRSISTFSRGNIVNLLRTMSTGPNWTHFLVSSSACPNTRTNSVKKTRTGDGLNSAPSSTPLHICTTTWCLHDHCFTCSTTSLRHQKHTARCGLVPPHMHFQDCSHEEGRIDFILFYLIPVLAHAIQRSFEAFTEVGTR